QEAREPCKRAPRATIRPSAHHSAVARMRPSHHLNRQPSFADLAAAGTTEALDDVLEIVHRQRLEVVHLELLGQLEADLDRRRHARDRLAGIAFVEAYVERLGRARRNLDIAAATDKGVRLEPVREDARHRAFRILIIAVEETVLAGARLDDERVVDAEARMAAPAGLDLDLG